MINQEPYIDKEFYMKKFNTEAAIEFWNLCEKIEKYNKNQGWFLTRNNNQAYVSFKYVDRIVFGLHYNNKNWFSIFFKITENMVSNPDVLDFEMYYGHTQEELRYYIPASANIELKLFDEHFEAAYENITSTK
ncbi:hypothetical protein [Methanobacterium sp. MBAC-LM]|uniref:hypothetical protein n=1 Tax=Methanobacterium sp. MBAC-LM TaxID=3412034 RepID=UPI003C72A895